MKIEKQIGKVTITLENIKEETMMALLLGNIKTIPKALAKEYPELDEEKLKECLINLDCDQNITPITSQVEKYFLKKVK